jgi:LSD1 subclass zinc finger protein
MSSPAANTNRLDKLMKDCQPFRDGAATLVCISCLKMLTFPSGAKRVRCGNCSAVTTGVTIKCTACREKMSVNLGVEVAKCPKCHYEFSPVAKLKILIPDGQEEDKLPRVIDLRVLIDSAVTASLHEASVKAVTTQPLRESAKLWEQQVQSDFSRCGFYVNSMLINPAHTPRQMELNNGDTIEIRRSKQKNVQGHEFAPSQFSGPTNCAYCKEFIWGIYKQGCRCTKCRVPVHHRCVESVSSLCEADLRNMFGIVNFNDDDDEGQEAPVLGVVVDDEDRAIFSSRLQESVAPECNPAFMSGLNKLSNFSDDEIQALWLKYDKDESGTLDREEMRQFVVDLVSAGGGKFDDLTDLREPVDRLIRRMDTNHDDQIQWEEFWYFLKAQQDHNFLETFRSTKKFSTDDLYKLWYHYDADQSGELELDELLNLLGDMLGSIGDDLANARVIKAKYKGRMQSFLQPNAKMNWETFCSTVVPLITHAVNAHDAPVTARARANTTV